MEFKQLVADPKLENEGKWFTFDKDFEVLIAHTNAKAYQKAINKVIFNRRKAGRDTSLEAQTGADVQADMMFKTVVKSWRGLTQDGEAVPFNKRTFTQLLVGSQRLRDWISNIATEVTNFQCYEEPEEETEEGVNSARAELKSVA
jgi:hypothetical protein